jgi:cytochrome P450
MTSVDSQSTKCPVVHLNYTEPKPAGTWHQTYDEQRAQFPWYRNDFGDEGFWTFVNYESILQVLQDAKTFSSSSVLAYEPNPPFKWIPEMLDGDEHKQWRRQLGPLFSPSAVERLDASVRQLAVELVDGIAGKGLCDFMTEFAQKFPTTIFLRLMGLPLGELDQFLEWEHAILHSSVEDEESRQAQLAAMMAVMGRFNTIIAERRVEPRDDIISKALTYEVDGKPVSDMDLLSFCLLMFMAGLDTVSVTLGWSFAHLADHADDRARIVADPALIPNAIEEFMRVYAIVIPARKATADAEIQGCPVKAGDMVCVPLNAATRDEAAYPDATTVDITRFPNNHIAFGAGPHRCLGSHLARRELRIALEEWHKRIPDYQIAPGAQLVESGGQIGLHSLPLVWDV